MTEYRIDVFGHEPGPAGSKVWTGSFMKDMGGAKTKAWRKAIAWAWKRTYGPPQPIHGPISLDVTFYLARPKKHYRTGRYAHILRDDAPAHHLKPPDTTKLLRSTEDELSGIAWVDDSQVVEQTARKRWAPEGRGPGAHIIIREYKEETE